MNNIKVFIPILFAMFMLVNVFQMVLAAESMVQINIPWQKVDLDWDKDGKGDQFEANVDMQNWKTAEGFFSFGLDDVWTITKGEMTCGRYGTGFQFEIFNTVVFTDPGTLTMNGFDSDNILITLNYKEDSSFTFDAMGEVTWVEDNPCK